MRLPLLLTLALLACDTESKMPEASQPGWTPTDPTVTSAWTGGSGLGATSGVTTGSTTGTSTGTQTTGTTTGTQTTGTTTGAQTTGTTTSPTTTMPGTLDTGFATCLCDPYAAPFGGGAGLSTDPWQICSSAQLDEVRNTASDAHTLCDDVDLSGVSFAPIPDYYGDFDGGGHTISNWSYADTSSVSGKDLGLFSRVDGAIIRRLVIDNAQLDSWSTSGILARRLTNGAQVKHIDINGAVLTGIDGHLGGAITTVEAGTSVHHLAFEGTVDNVGYGFVGGVIDSCAGICTQLLGEGSVTSGAWKTGGLVQSVSAPGVLRNSVSRMTVNGVDRVGGITAVMNGGVIRNVYFEGSANGTFWVSGIVAETWNTQNPEIDQVYVSGAVSNTTTASGIGGANILAYDATSAVITSAAWDNQTTGQTGSAGGQGVLTADLQDPLFGLFANWAAPWVLVAGDYPRLDWE
jgi:hypothetical protein